MYIKTLYFIDMLHYIIICRPFEMIINKPFAVQYILLFVVYSNLLTYLRVKQLFKQ